MATLYWKVFVGNLIGEHSDCEGGCDCDMPNSGLLTNDPKQTDYASKVHLEMGVASSCHRCTRRHLIISEALAHHSEFLRRSAVKDAEGALRAARKRCTLIQKLSSQNG